MGEREGERGREGEREGGEKDGGKEGGRGEERVKKVKTGSTPYHTGGCFLLVVYNMRKEAIVPSKMGEYVVALLNCSLTERFSAGEEERWQRALSSWLQQVCVLCTRTLKGCHSMERECSVQ